MLQSKLPKEMSEDFQNISLPPLMPPLQAAGELSKAFAAIEYLGRLKSDGLITEHEFGEYKGKILKRIV
jgi:hypothetical protein